MKTISVYFNAVLVGALAFTLLAFGWPNGRAQAAASTPTPPQAQPACETGRSVQVSGTAVVNVLPDRVLIQLGVQSNGASVTEVQNANSLAIQRVIQALHAQGVPDKDIATDWYIIEPLYDDYDSLYIKGYRINNLIGVTLREAGKTSSLIAAALRAGANQVVNVEFYTSELRKYRDQARQMAMQAAAEKAAALAEAADSTASCVLTISENSWSYYNGGWWNSSRNLWTQNAVQNAPGGGSAGPAGDAAPVSLGQISIQAQVGVTYSLK